MSNWIALIPDDIKAAAIGNLVDRAQTLATGSVDPIADAIENFTAEVRNAVRAGNRLDTDPMKIPRSLKRLAVRLIIAALSERIGLKLSEDQARQAGNDQKRLQQLYNRKEQVEPADNPDTSGGPVNPGTWNSENKIIMRTHPVPAPGVQFSPGRYANPDAPQDSIG